MEENEIIYSDVPLAEEQDEVVIDEVMPVVEITEIESYDIEMQEAFPSTEGNTSYNHALLNNREINDAHPISAITGLRAELNAIEALKTVYSDKKGNADYYEWANGNLVDGVGYFVTLNKDVRTITICTGDDIFGVVVDNAAFVGGQDDVARDGHYGLVATSGVVHVRCELDVAEGDYVVSNSYGIATKASSNYGYKVVAVHDIKGVLCATIQLNITADRIDSMGAELQGLDSRMDAAETNIISAVNTAHQAYNKANEIGVSNQEMSSKVDSALGVVDKLENDVINMGEQVSSSALAAAQAKAIAESAVTSAASMKNEAVEKSKEALAETSELRREMEAMSVDMNSRFDNSALEMEAVKENLENTRNNLQKDIDDAVGDLEDLVENLEPLATWPKDATGDDIKGVAGFVARADTDSATLASMVTWKGDAGDSLAGFVQEATEENATVKSIASYKRKDANGNVVEPGGASGLTAQVDANQSELNAVASYEKDGAKGLAGIMAQVDENKSELSAVASYEKGDAKGLAGLVAQVDANKSELNTVASYEKDGKTGLAGLSAYVDEHESKVSVLTEYSNGDSGNSGVAGLVADVDDNTSTLSVVAQHSFTKDDGTVVTGLAGLQAQVEDNTSEVSLVANRVAGKYTVIDSWNESGKNTNTVYYAKDTKLYWYYSNGWKNTADAYVAGLPASTAGIQVVADEHSSKINSLAAFDTNTEINLARIEQKADANGAYIQSTVSNMDKYAVGPYSQAYGFTLEQAASVLEEGMIYVPTKTKTGDDAETYDYTDANGDVQTYTRNFVKGYLYKWGKLTDYPYGWITVDKNYVETTETNTSAQAVYFTTDEPEVSGNFGYWYTDGNTVASPYEPYTLYKWDLPYKYDGEDGNDVEEYHWVAVATLAGNSSNRAVSQIRQDANSIEMRVTNTEGDVASVKADLSGTNAIVQTVAEWKTGVEKDVSNIATIKSTADAASASISQVVEAVGEDGEVNAASIVAAVIDDESSITLLADNITLDASQITLNGEATFTTTDSDDGTTKINGGNIATGTVTAEQLSADALKSNNYPHNIYDADGKLIGPPVDNEGDVPYSTNGTFLNLNDGSIYSPNFVIGPDGKTYINGNVTAPSGSIGAWNIGTITNPGGFWGGSANTYKNSLYTISASGSDTKITDEDTLNAQKNDCYLAFLRLPQGNSSHVMAIRRRPYNTSTETFDSVETPFAISKNGAVHMTSGDIAGWDITNETLSKNGVGMSVGNKTKASLVKANNTSPIRFYAGEPSAMDDISEETKTQVLTFDATAGQSITQQIVLSEAEQQEYVISDADIVTTTQTHTRETEVLKQTINVADMNYITDGEGHYTYSTTVYINSVFSEGENYQLYSSNLSSGVSLQLEVQGTGAKVQVTYSPPSTTHPTKISFSIYGTYDIKETLEVSKTYDNTTINITLFPQYTAQYQIECRYKLQTRDANFIVLEDGSLYANAAKIRGSIYASDGDIGGLKIDNGIKGYRSDVEAFSLASDGLVINSDSAKIQVGNVEIYNQDYNTYLQANGALSIQGMENNKPITAIELMTDDGGTPVTSTLELEVTKNHYVSYAHNNSVNVCLTSTAKLYYPVTLTVYYLSAIKAYGSIDWSSSDVKTVSLRINAGMDTSETVTIDIGGDDYMRFGLSSDTSSATTFDLGAYNSHTVTLQTITQTKSNNNIKITGNLIPTIPSPDGGGAGYNLGQGNCYWNTIFARTSGVDLSDENQKNTIQPLSEVHTQIFDALKPVSYKFNVSNNNRTHTGLIAQDVKRAVENAGLTTQDFAAYCEWENDDGSIGCGLRYSEFVSLCIDQIQKLKKRVEELEEKLNTTQND